MTKSKIGPLGGEGAHNREHKHEYRPPSQHAPGDHREAGHGQQEKLPSYLKRRSQMRPSGGKNSETAGMSALRMEMAKDLTGETVEVDEIDAIEHRERRMSMAKPSLHPRRSTMNLLMDAKSLDRQLAAAGAGVHHAAVEKEKMHKSLHRNSENQGGPQDQVHSGLRRISTSNAKGDLQQGNSFHGTSQGHHHSFASTGNPEPHYGSMPARTRSSGAGVASTGSDHGLPQGRPPNRAGALPQTQSLSLHRRSLSPEPDFRSTPVVIREPQQASEQMSFLASAVSPRPDQYPEPTGLDPPEETTQCPPDNYMMAFVSMKPTADSPENVLPDMHQANKFKNGTQSLPTWHAEGSKAPATGSVPVSQSKNSITLKAPPTLEEDTSPTLQLNSAPVIRKPAQSDNHSPGGRLAPIHARRKSSTSQSSRSPSTWAESMPSTTPAKSPTMWAESMPSTTPAKSPTMWADTASANKGFVRRMSTEDATGQRRLSTEQPARSYSSLGNRRWSDEGPQHLDFASEGSELSNPGLSVSENQERITPGRITAKQGSQSEQNLSPAQLRMTKRPSDLTIAVDSPTDGSHSPFRTLQHMKRSPPQPGTDSPLTFKKGSSGRSFTPSPEAQDLGPVRVFDAQSSPIPQTGMLSGSLSPASSERRQEKSSDMNSAPERDTFLLADPTARRSITGQSLPAGTKQASAIAFDRNSSPGTEDEAFRRQPSSGEVSDAEVSRTVGTPKARGKRRSMEQIESQESQDKALEEGKEGKNRGRRKSLVTATEVAAQSAAIMSNLQIDQQDKFRSKHPRNTESGTTKSKPFAMDSPSADKGSYFQEAREVLKSFDDEEATAAAKTKEKEREEEEEMDISKICDPVEQMKYKNKIQEKKLVRHWTKVKEALDSAPITTIRELHDRMLTYTEDYSLKGGTCLGLETILAQEEEKGSFFNRTLPCVIARAKQMLKEFSYGTIPKIKHGKRDKLVYTRSQVATIIANMFLCAFPGGEGSFASLFISRQAHQVAKLKFFVHYFDRLSTLPMNEPTGRITVVQNCKAKQNSELERSQMPLLPVRVHMEGRVRDQEGHLQVVATTPELFGGLLSRGLGDAEIRCLGAPEMAVCLVVAKYIDEGSVMIVRGAEQYSIVEGEDFSLRWGGDYQDQSPREKDGSFISTMALMDPKRFDRHEGCGVFTQLSAVNLNRELEKASTAFEILPDTANFGSIASDFWGCGRMMKGNPEIRTLILWAAASNAGREFDLFVSKDIRFKRVFEEAHSILTGNSQTVADLIQAMHEAHHMEELETTAGGVIRGVVSCVEIEGLSQEQIEDMGHGLSFDSLRRPSTANIWEPVLTEDCEEEAQAV